LTLSDHGGYEICPVCDWEDDPTTIFKPGERGGPNHLSLTEGRRHFAEQGISKLCLNGRRRACTCHCCACFAPRHMRVWPALVLASLDFERRAS
jgi:hypothetical protein